eukprot:TRINITY_DN1301_c1_g1_i1.p1 TRINITY_DN1301_c1_g1~~TRINITY_DN1301_c1_g1_i1.p1  ORF type:complete len:189 (+),score=21.01 TRINITY_DN1301_c1_g1_i1:84-650(+)
MVAIPGSGLSGWMVGCLGVEPQRLSAKSVKQAPQLPSEDSVSSSLLDEYLGKPLVRPMTKGHQAVLEATRLGGGWRPATSEPGARHAAEIVEQSEVAAGRQPMTLPLSSMLRVSTAPALTRPSPDARRFGRRARMTDERLAEESCTSSFYGMRPMKIQSRTTQAYNVKDAGSADMWYFRSTRNPSVAK